MPAENHYAYKPAEIAALIETAGVAKAALPLRRMATLALLAGAFIGFGAAFWCMAMAGTDMSYGPNRVLGGTVFALGLILCVVGGAELFTGNALMVMAAVDRKIGPGALLRNWAVVYLGNLVGAVGLAIAFGLSGLLDGPMGEVAAKVATAKAALDPVEAFVRGALCNALVCLAVWLSFAARSSTDKILGVLWPVGRVCGAGAGTLGREHVPVPGGPLGRVRSDAGGDAGQPVLGDAGQYRGWGGGRGAGLSLCLWGDAGVNRIRAG